MNQANHQLFKNVPDRLPELKQKVEQWLGHSQWQITPASSDASFRRYFRVSLENTSYIVMDAPPKFEDCRPFVKIAKKFRSFGVNVPEILQEDLANGFLMISDLGDRQYLDELNENTAQRLYRDATASILRLHRADHGNQLPSYDQKKLNQEVSLFHEWFLTQHLHIDLSDTQLKLIHEVYDELIKTALEQPQVVVHRDYHSRNLMMTPKNNPGIIDFQDAVIGAITYDLASLFRDCYISWPVDQVFHWLDQHRVGLLQNGVIEVNDKKQFEHWFDYMGMQRQLKCVGIFSRLNIRDGKPGYLKDIPRTFNYIVEVLKRRGAFADFSHFVDRIVLPAMQSVAK